MAFAYRCGDFPGMEACPASFVTKSEEELWQHIEVHAVKAHQEDPANWSAEDRRQMKELIRAS